MNQEPRYEEKAAFRAVGMSIVTTAMSSEIPGLWFKFAPRIGEISPVSEPRVSYGIMRNMDDQTGKFEYVAAVPVGPDAVFPQDMIELELEAKTYAIFDATLSTIGEVFGQIHQSWLPMSGYALAKTPFFERYGETFNPMDPNSALEIYIPVEPQD